MSLLTKSEEPAVKLTSGQRLARGLKEAALAPIDVSRGTAGLSFGLAKSATSAAVGCSVGARPSHQRCRTPSPTLSTPSLRWSAAPASASCPAH